MHTSSMHKNSNCIKPAVRAFVKRIAKTLTAVGVSESQEITIYGRATGEPTMRLKSHIGDFARAGIGGRDGHPKATMLFTRMVISPALRESLKKRDTVA